MSTRRRFIQAGLTAALGTAARGAPGDPRFKHVIVLMLENRSFDHMLGFSQIPGTEIPQDHSREFDSAGVEVPLSSKGVISGPDGVDPDPDHDFKSVMLQMYGKPSYDKAATPSMDHFVRSYETACRNSGVPEGQAVARSHNVMKCQPPEHVPVLIQLATKYALCTSWFASIPGPTLPNRLFAHFGTSGGRLDMSVVETGLGKSIYEVLGESGVSATIYAGSLSALATVPSLAQYQDRYFGTLDDFYDDCADNDLPGYCFIEPRYGSTVEDGVFRPQNDQHPDSDLTAGEELIFSVYDAIRSRKEVWESSALIICYDEHGGIYDHVVPPVAVAPGDGKPSIDPAFDFTRYGVRVPAVVVSPFTPSGMVITETCDHTSIIACARKLLTGTFQDNALWARARQAYPLDKAFTGAARAAEELDFERPVSNLKRSRPMNDLQRFHVNIAQQIESKMAPGQQTGINPEHLKTDQDAQHYVSRVYKQVIKGPSK